MADNEEPLEESGGGTGKGLLIVGIVLGLGLGAAGGWYFFSGEEPVEQVIDEEEPVFQMEVPVEGVRLPVFDKRGRYSGTVRIRVVLMVYQGQDYGLAMGFTSQLKHAFLMALSSLEPPSAENQTVHNPDEIAALLLPVAQETLGDIKVHALHVNDLEFNSNR